MILPDFTDFESFNELRAKMDTDQLGFFELFDPAHHLTGMERSELGHAGLLVTSSALHRLLDFTLIYKNSRVLVKGAQCFHLSECSQFPYASTYQISTDSHSFGGNAPVCGECLQKLQYKGYDALKARKESYSQDVLVQFKLSQYWKSYHQYPISEKKGLRKELVQ